MNTWFLCTVRYTQQQEDGSFKRVNEKYLFAALSFTDAEARIYEELGAIIRGEFVVQAIAREDLEDIFRFEDSETWHKVKATYDNINDSGKSKKVVQYFYVSADTVKEATQRVEAQLKEYMVDYTVRATVESPVIEIFPYVEDLDKEISRTPLEEKTEEEKPV